MQIYRIGATDSLYADLGSTFVLHYQPLHDSLGRALPASMYPGKPRPYEFKTGCTQWWSVAYTLTIPTDWKSGVYYVKCSLVDSPAVSRRAPFVVKAATPGSTSRILYKLPYSTYQAYTSWGGSSFYWTDDLNFVQDNDTVSFLRPLGGNHAEITDLGSFDRDDSTFVRWAERSGYAMEYCTNIDLDTDYVSSTPSQFISAYCPSSKFSGVIGSLIKR